MTVSPVHPKLIASTTTNQGYVMLASLVSTFVGIPGHSASQVATIVAVVGTIGNIAQFAAGWLKAGPNGLSPAQEAAAQIDSRLALLERDVPSIKGALVPMSGSVNKALEFLGVHGDQLAQVTADVASLAKQVASTASAPQPAPVNIVSHSLPGDQTPTPLPLPVPPGPIPVPIPVPNTPTV